MTDHEQTGAKGDLEPGAELGQERAGPAADVERRFGRRDGRCRRELRGERGTVAADLTAGGPGSGREVDAASIAGPPNAASPVDSQGGRVCSRR